MFFVRIDNNGVIFFFDSCYYLRVTQRHQIKKKNTDFSRKKKKGKKNSFTVRIDDEVTPYKNAKLTDKERDNCVKFVYLNVWSRKATFHDHVDKNKSNLIQSIR